MTIGYVGYLLNESTHNRGATNTNQPTINQISVQSN